MFQPMDKTNQNFMLKKFNRTYELYALKTIFILNNRCNVIITDSERGHFYLQNTIFL